MLRPKANERVWKLVTSKTAIFVLFVQYQRRPLTPRQKASAGQIEVVAYNVLHRQVGEPRRERATLQVVLLRGRLKHKVVVMAAGKLQSVELAAVSLMATSQIAVMALTVSAALASAGQPERLNRLDRKLGLMKIVEWPAAAYIGLSVICGRV